MNASSSDRLDPMMLVDDVHARLDAEHFDVTVEPIGWQCRHCGGRFSVSDPASTPAWRHDGLVANVVDSAEYHLRADHPDPDRPA